MMPRKLSVVRGRSLRICDDSCQPSRRALARRVSDLLTDRCALHRRSRATREGSTTAPRIDRRECDPCRAVRPDRVSTRPHARRMAERPSRASSDRHTHRTGTHADRRRGVAHVDAPKRDVVARRRPASPTERPAVSAFDSASMLCAPSCQNRPSRPFSSATGDACRRHSADHLHTAGVQRLRRSRAVSASAIASPEAANSTSAASPRRPNAPLVRGAAIVQPTATTPLQSSRNASARSGRVDGPVGFTSGERTVA